MISLFTARGTVYKASGLFAAPRLKATALSASLWYTAQGFVSILIVGILIKANPRCKSLCHV